MVTPADYDAQDAAEYSNLSKARRLVVEAQDLRGVLEEYKRAFVGDDLDGGWKAALEHPTYLQAQARIVEIHEELKGLI